MNFEAQPDANKVNMNNITDTISSGVTNTIQSLKDTVANTKNSLQQSMNEFSSKSAADASSAVERRSRGCHSAPRQKRPETTMTVSDVTRVITSDGTLGAIRRVTRSRIECMSVAKRQSKPYRFSPSAEGCTSNSTPPKPTRIAIQRGLSTRSRSTRTASAVTIRGEAILMAIASPRGMCMSES